MYAMLRDKLYTILSEDADRFTIRILPEAEILKAHFEGFSIVPGVCVTRIATELLQEKLGGIILSKGISVRFLNPVYPDGKDLQYSFQIDGLKVKAEVSSGNEKKAVMNLEYERQDSAHI